MPTLESLAHIGRSIAAARYIPTVVAWKIFDEALTAAGAISLKDSFLKGATLRVRTFIDLHAGASRKQIKSLVDISGMVSAMRNTSMMDRFAPLEVLSEARGRKTLVTLGKHLDRMTDAGLGLSFTQNLYQGAQRSNGALIMATLTEYIGKNVRVLA